ncbi:hypothetical protein PENTCL1PPCAC_25713, partial [Pristionchus entomophagus]
MVSLLYVEITIVMITVWRTPLAPSLSACRDASMRGATCSSSLYTASRECPSRGQDCNRRQRPQYPRAKSARERGRRSPFVD